MPVWTRMLTYALTCVLNVCADMQEILEKRLREQSESLAALDALRAELSSLLELLDNETLLP